MVFALPSKNQIASFDVDCQNTFTPHCPNELPVVEGHLIADELNLQASFAAYRVGSKDAHSEKAVWIANDEHPPLSPLEGYPHADVYWPVHAIPGTKGFELIQGLPAITDYDFFVWKGVEPDLHPYGACYHDLDEKISTGIIEFLKTKNITTVLVGGLATDYCVKTTALQLRKTGFTVIVNLAACRGISTETVKEAIQLLKKNDVLFIASAQALSTGKIE